MLKKLKLCSRPFVIWPLPAPLTCLLPPSPLCPWGCSSHMPTHSASGPLHLPFPLLDLYPRLLYGPLSYFIRFLLKRFFSRKSPSFSNPWFLFKALPTMSYSICAFLLPCHLSCPLECKLSKGRDFILFTAIVLCLKQSLEKKQNKTRAWITHRRGSINTYWMSKKQTWIALKGPTAPSSLRQWENHRTKSHKILILVQVFITAWP